MTPYPTRDPAAFSRRQVIFWFTVWTALAAAAAYLTMLSGFSLYDDEGTLMITVKPYLAGAKLYDQIFTIYGPVYYYYRWAVHTLSGTDVTHNAVRISALIPWLTSVLLCAWIALRLTGSLVLAGLAHLMTSFVLVFFAWEPGHPQDLTMMLLVALAAAAVPAGGERWRTPRMLAMGALAAALMLVKINTGAFAMAALTVALGSCGSARRVWQAAGWMAGAACIALPLLLMRRHLDLPEIRIYCWLATASTAACIACLSRSHRESGTTQRDCVLAAAGFGGAFLAGIAILLAQGVTLSATYECLVAAPARIFLSHPHLVYWPRLQAGTGQWTLLGLGAALLTGWKNPLPGTREFRVLFAGKGAFCALTMTALCFDLPLLSVVPPFVWLLLYRPCRTHDWAQVFARRLLAILTVLQVLYAYPIAGSQARFTLVLLRLTVVVCLGDVLVWLSEARAPAGLARWWRAWGRTCATVGLCAVAAAHAQEAIRDYVDYRAWPSLDLQGAQLVHADPEVVANFQWVVRNLKQNCDSFESLPGLPSLNFWTGIAPLTLLNADGWTVSLSPEQQQRVAAALATHARACIVYNPDILEQWNMDGGSVEGLPLVRYIRQNFRTVGHSGKYQLMLRNERTDTAGVR